MARVPGRVMWVSERARAEIGFAGSLFEVLAGGA